jgi:RNA polymerase sigma factor (sigma-70 family)
MSGGLTGPDAAALARVITQGDVSAQMGIRYARVGPRSPDLPIAGCFFLDKTSFMEACRDGGQRIDGALRLLDRSYFAVLYRESVRAIGDRDVARDLVQETFIKVWQRCATFRGESELLPWVRTILRRLILDRLRQPQREVPLEDDMGLTPAAIQQITQLSGEQVVVPEDALKQRQLAEVFQRCWDRFAQACPEHALVISWIAEDGLSHEEIGALLERTPGATREFISQCRKRARIYLAEWHTLAFSEGRADA